MIRAASPSVKLAGAPFERRNLSFRRSASARVRSGAASASSKSSSWRPKSTAIGASFARIATLAACRTELANQVHILDKHHIDSYSRETMATRELLNVRDTARALGVHENTVRNWEARGILRAVHLPGSGFRRFAIQDVERLRAEMFEQFAPATEGPVVNPGRKRSGRLVFGDANE
jgi:hypothetical protein